ncbi:uncharacterized protein K452DRAFT_3258 [Aplosporella prunicola CBS 121167]|uniref:Uncharacterized protein n=1 Tax=Aplosporella prunicola CBS 121167 TaxID=1176127 RepID=A0A6A6BTR4_9PEZI|nr:uncharacterized protein K452DRAFT_3258 [Aplosporella prunicola CBS 121167]KAF2147198.1 hypothetical protein K452DRAFT_3258 [Aplosporella prunicola CBS 121167]
MTARPIHFFLYFANGWMDGWDFFLLLLLLLLHLWNGNSGNASLVGCVQLYCTTRQWTLRLGASAKGVRVRSWLRGWLVILSTTTTYLATTITITTTYMSIDNNHLLQSKYHCYPPIQPLSCQTVGRDETRMTDLFPCRMYLICMYSNTLGR